jgi:thioredoxin-like negative regulator of GroEL
MLIYVYTDWCHNCRSLKPIIKEFKSKYGNILDIRELDGDKNQKIIEELKVEGFPTIILLNNGKRIEFKGKRTLSALEAFVKSNLNSQTKFNTQRGGGGPLPSGVAANTLYYAYSPGCGHCTKFTPIFDEFQKQYGGKFINIVKLNAADENPKTQSIIKSLGVHGFPTVNLIDKNGQQIEFDGDRTVEGLSSFIKPHINPHLNDNLANYRAMP